MVRNLLGNLAFSPSMLGSVGFYINRLKQEEFSRRLGLIFTASAVVLQSLAIVSPPEPAIAAGPNNIIYNGVLSVADLLDRYDRNDAGKGKHDLQAIFSHYGISREDLAKAKPTTIKSIDRNRQLRSIGRKAYGKQGERAVPIQGGSTVYERYLWSWDSGAHSKYTAFVGTTADGRWFAVLANCGNLVIDEPPPGPEDPIGEINATCEAITGWAYDPNQITKTVKVRVYLQLENGFKSSYLISANLPEPRAPVAGNHGFKQVIPNKHKSSSRKTIYTVVALDASGGGRNTDLAKSVSIQTHCLSPEPEPCPYDRSITRTDNKCKECPYQDNVRADSKKCKPPQPEIETCTYNDELAENDPACVPCPHDAALWVDDDNCQEPFTLFVYDKKASNQTQNLADANGTTAQPGDILIYTLTVENLGNQTGKVVVEEDMSDVLEYAELISVSDNGRKLSDNDAGLISWGEVELPGGQVIERTIAVKIKDNIPAAAALNSNPESNNLELRNVFHKKAVVINVPRPLAKTPEVLAATLPNTGPGTNAVLAALTLAASVYFYLRNRQLTKELALIKQAYSAGGL
jgi:hypothetical protein